MQERKLWYQWDVGWKFFPGDAHKFPLGPEESNLVWSMSGTEKVDNGGIDNNIK
jgi:hypothetical protein